MNLRKVILFFFLATGLSLVGFYLGQWLLPAGTTYGDLFGTTLSLLLYCWGPAAAAYILQKYLYQGSLSQFGWNRKHYSLRWIGLTLVLPVGVIAGTVLLVALLGNVLHLPGFGVILLSDGIATAYEPGLAAFKGLTDALPIVTGTPPEVWTLAVIILLGGLFFGATFNLLFNVGEEMGWRGLVLTETRSLGFLGSALITGLLWGLWNVPLALGLGEMPLATDHFFELLALVGYCVALSFPMAYLALKARSVYASATFLGVINNIHVLAGFFIWDENPLLGSPRGMAGMLVLMGITFLILRFDPRFVETYASQKY
ncbi:MAG: hypothetical protein D6722_07855 [Bacteroidetes bacterium]|nr:MAG: hypothetical protein D6722_07855 [Bacteroidota bacterium]